MVALTLPGPTSAAERPNIVLILADDLGWGDVGCNNAQSKIPTPHIDKLATQGMRFTDAHSSSGVCVPSRFSLLTGRHAFRLIGGGNQSTRPLIPADCPTLPGILTAVGYDTSMIGKWHLGFDDLLKRPTEPLRGGPLDRGFQHYFGTPSSNDIEPYLYIDGDRIVAQATEAMPAHASPGWPDDRQGEFWRAGKAAPGFRHGDVLPTLTRHAVAELQRMAAQADERPFFLYYAMPAPHSPLMPSDEFRGRTNIGIYGDYVAQTDDAVGRVLRVLQETGTLANTLVFFTSDNGPFWFPGNVEQTGHRASGPYRGLKADAWEGGHRMPFIARWPGHISAGTTSDALISLTDLLATTAALLAIPRDPATADSVDFSPALLGKPWTRPEQHPLVARSSQGALTIRSGNWKFINQLGSGGFSKPAREQPAAGQPNAQLYNLAHDPGEQRNLAASEPARTLALRQQLKSVLESHLPAKAREP
jgi:arylsulfatase A-like enzyme